ncbi:MAG: low molecular weight protein-tyrosine-phosphatase [Bacteroidota bacterium]|nr:low molecular weight protein-tyrosine-phosphatase [Bacteroidota bacterium]
MKIKILMVCLGNICRSPLAEGILKSKLDLEKFEVDSAGTGGWHKGESPDKRSVEVAKTNGIDISKQRARQIQKSDFQYFDYIYVMDKSNYADVLALAPNQEVANKVNMILNEVQPHSDKDVPDPYYGGKDGFEKVYKMLDEACQRIADNLR